MPGPVATGNGIGIGANAPTNKLAGIGMTAFAAFGGILFGYDTGTISGIIAMLDWLKLLCPSSRQSLVVSILSAGTFLVSIGASSHHVTTLIPLPSPGALIGAPVADIIGRRHGIQFACLVFVLGVALQVGSHNIATFVVGRVFAGLGVGLVSTLIPMYQSECAPKWIRGAVVAGYQWAVTIGLLLASFIWAFIVFTGMFFLPEAANALGRLTGLSPTDPEVEVELADISANLEEERALGESSYLDCFRFSHNKIFLRTMSGIFIQAWQQLTGINFIFYYGTTFFSQAGIKNAFLVSVATNIVNVFMTIPGMWGVERFGRRSLLLWGAAWMTMCEFLIAIVGVTISVDNKAGQQALIALTCLYIAAFASTWGPIAWIITGEIYPLNVRAKAMSMSVASNWLWNFGIGYATPYLVFFIWGSTCAGAFVFTYFFIPETKGLSLEQIDLLYQNSTPLTSVAYRRELVANDVHAADHLAERHHDEKVVDEKV
ncbi:MFS monosaccharide transporter [Fomitopsis serialis]|uniref:MFS monosaccharide transporter n=1 Tax=Fomitopsis serialis TaxID=139415 RepID=UPI00200814A3|nr:MFS monosaccharide transporter [Neoantrodia serialis]KAH9933296.1 MFS monosaccharide transporter [Neoantrodia serialis]